MEQVTRKLKCIHFLELMNNGERDHCTISGIITVNLVPLICHIHCQYVLGTHVKSDPQDD